MSSFIAKMTFAITATNQSFIRATTEGTRTLTKQEKQMISLMKVVRSLSRSFLGLAGVYAVFRGTSAAIRGLIQPAASLEEAMKRVQAVSGSTVTKLKAVNEEVRRLGATTRFTATQVAQGAISLAQGGLNPQEIRDSLSGVLSLSSIGNIGLDESARITIGALRGLKLEARETQRVVDSLAITATRSPATISGLGISLSTVVPIAEKAGLSIEDVSAALGTLASRSIVGSRAGTGFRGAIASIINPSQEAAKVLKDLGVATKDVSGNARGFLDIASDLAKAGITLQQGFTIAGREAAPALLTLIGNVDEWKARKEVIKVLAGESEKIRNIMEEGVSGAVRELKSAWEGLMISLSDAGALRFVEDFVDLTADLVRNIKAVPDWMNRVSGTAGVRNIDVPTFSTQTYQHIPEMQEINNEIDKILERRSELTQEIARIEERDNRKNLKSLRRRRAELDKVNKRYEQLKHTQEELAKIYRRQKERLDDLTKINDAIKEEVAYTERLFNIQSRINSQVGQKRVDAYNKEVSALENLRDKYQTILDVYDKTDSKFFNEETIENIATTKDELANVVKLLNDILKLKPSVDTSVLQITQLPATPSLLRSNIDQRRYQQNQQGTTPWRSGINIQQVAPFNRPSLLLTAEDRQAYEETRRRFGLIEEAGVKAFTNISDAIRSSIRQAKSLGEALQRIGIEVLYDFLNALGTKEGRTNLGRIFGGGRALGGPVKAGMIYNTGEFGPEKIMMPADGYVIPNQALRNPGTTVKTFNIYSQPGQDITELAYEIDRIDRREYNKMVRY